ncbi:ribonuclease P protein component [Anaerocolumna xylanovorans DSM 12503]|uniref:Ribonuclease P protein component n=1 Tax=Anaerocolumna xylanovorans DSM 12503 TaxID=1121345 RepID=A0A1M7YNS2_9FIRM|nr:ribonuclease P protein component [Anaerocolumna xylanovorans DSM 12503]
MAFSSLRLLQRKGRDILRLSESMKKNANFKSVYKSGKSYANTYLIMYVMENSTKRNKIGISVSKKVGNSVIRHRITRLIRESYRLNEEMFNSGLDIIVIARAGAKGKKYLEINSALLHLARMHRILKETIKS